MANLLHSNFLGGMNSNTSPLHLKENEAEFILNYDLDTKTGALKKRNGYNLFYTDSTNTLSANGLFGTMNPNNRALMAYLTVNDGTPNRKTYYYKAADDAWTATDDTGQTPFLPAGSASQIYMTRFASFLNYIFRVNGGDVPVSFLITTPQTKTTVNLKFVDNNAITSIKPSLIEVYQNRIFINNITDNYRSRIYYSTLGTSGGTVTWGATEATTTQWRDIIPDDGDFITALKNTGSHMLIFKSSHLYRYYFDEAPVKVADVGTPSQESVATSFELGLTFFANPNGIYQYPDGGRPKLISKKIQEYIDAVSSWTYVAGGVDKKHYYLSVGNLTVNGRTINNAVLVYHIYLDAWTIYSMATSPLMFAEIPAVYPNRLLCFGTTGGVYKMSTSISDYVQATAKSIETEVITKEHLLTMPERTTLEYIDIIAIQGGDTKVSYQIDRNLMGLEGDFVSCKERLNRRVNTLRVGKEMHTVRIRLADNSQRPSIIEGYNLEHTPKKDR